MPKICTRHQWIEQLAQSNVVASMCLKTQIKDADLKTDALNLANDEAHTRLIIRGVEKLIDSQASSKQNAQILLKDIISGKTYGSFPELAAYDWLMCNDLKIRTQVKMYPPDILGTNDVPLDGLIDVYGIYFDVKAFGLHGRLAQRLKERLKEEIPGFVVHVEGSWDISVERFEQLIQDASKIAADLRLTPIKHIGTLIIRIEKQRPVSILARTVLPYLLAKENATYPFRSANQFTKNAPFILIFVIHPWFNQSAIFNNFADSDSIFTRALSRRAFMQFTRDLQPLNSVCKEVDANLTFSDAAKLLSAIFFLNVWPEGAKLDRRTMPSSIYLNPRAIHPLNSRSVDLFRSSDPHILVDDFTDDNY